MELKIENHKNQLLREQNNKIYELELKYKNKERALERQQKAERDSYERAISSNLIFFSSLLEFIPFKNLSMDSSNNSSILIPSLAEVSI